MSDDLVSNDESRVLASLLSLDNKEIYLRYTELYEFYTQHKLYNAVVILPLVCYISGNSVELPVITPDNYVRFGTGSTSHDIKIDFNRLVRVNALQVYLVTRGLSNEELAKRFVCMHILACHMSGADHYLSVDDYKQFPSVICLLKLYEIDPVKTSNIILNSIN